MKRTAHYIDCTFGQLHYYRQGDTTDTPPLICFHMSPYSGRYYEKFQAEMAKDRLVICPDTPGYGGSSAPDAPASIEQLAGAMIELIEELGFEQADLLGFHTGVLIATEIANKCPEKVRKLVLPGIPLVPVDKRAAIRKNYENPRPYFEQEDFLSTKWTEAVASEKEGWDEKRKIDMFADVMRAGLKSNWGFMAVFDYDIESGLAALTQEVLIPIPDEMLSPSTRAAAAMIKNAEVQELPDVKADLFERNPNEFIQLVREFLRV